MNVNQVLNKKYPCQNIFNTLHTLIKDSRIQEIKYCMSVEKEDNNFVFFLRLLQ